MLPIFLCVQSAPQLSVAGDEETVRLNRPAAHGGSARNGSASSLARILDRLRCPVCQGKILRESHVRPGKNRFSPRSSSRKSLWAGRLLPTISGNIRAKQNYAQFAE